MRLGPEFDEGDTFLPRASSSRSFPFSFAEPNSVKNEVEPWIRQVDVGCQDGFNDEWKLQWIRQVVESGNSFLRCPEFVY